MKQPMTKATKDLYFTADKQAVVAAGSKDAAFLYCRAGTNIPGSAVEKFGLDDKGLPRRARAEKESAPVGGEGKAGQVGENKQGGKGSDKAGAKGGKK